MTRIIAGISKGIRLKTIKGPIVRPTSDKVKGAIFNILGDVIVGASVLDLFSGSGALGIEALSRGADSVVFVENNPRCINVIKENLKKGDFTANVIRGDVYRVIKKLRRNSFNIVLADPPYGKGLVRNLLSEIDKCSILKNFSFAIIEHSKWDKIEELKPWQKVQGKSYGDTVISVYRYEKNICSISRYI